MYVCIGVNTCAAREGATFPCVVFSDNHYTCEYYIYIYIYIYYTYIYIHCTHEYVYARVRKLQYMYAQVRKLLTPWGCAQEAGATFPCVVFLDAMKGQRNHPCEVTQAMD